MAPEKSKTFDILINTVKQKSQYYNVFSAENLASRSVQYNINQIILDDRTDVWCSSSNGLDPQNNIFKVKPYDFFSRYIGSPKKSDYKSELWEYNYIKNITDALINISKKSHNSKISNIPIENV